MWLFLLKFPDLWVKLSASRPRNGAVGFQSAGCLTLRAAQPRKAT